MSPPFIAATFLAGSARGRPSLALARRGRRLAPRDGRDRVATAILGVSLLLLAIAAGLTLVG